MSRRAERARRAMLVLAALPLLAAGCGGGGGGDDTGARDVPVIEVIAGGGAHSHDMAAGAEATDGGGGGAHSPDVAAGAEATDGGGGSSSTSSSSTSSDSDETEYRFELPDEIHAGPARIAIHNAGTEAHHAQLFRFDGDATVQDLASALATGGPAAAAELGSFVGGTGLVAPGEDSHADAVVQLIPGRYALLCLVPDASGTPHLAHGMLRPFEVAGGGDPAEAPEADAEVRLVDYAFDLPARIDGDATLMIANASAAEPHEMVLARLADGVTTDDVLAALHVGAPLPATPVGGMQALPPGERQLLQLDLEPGRYVALCAVPLPGGTGHYDAGMIDEITVT